MCWSDFLAGTTRSWRTSWRRASKTSLVIHPTNPLSRFEREKFWLWCNPTDRRAEEAWGMIFQQFLWCNSNVYPLNSIQSLCANPLLPESLPLAVLSVCMYSSHCCIWRRPYVSYSACFDQISSMWHTGMFRTIKIPFCGTFYTPPKACELKVRSIHIDLIPGKEAQ